MLSDKDGVPRLGVPPFGHTECTHGTLNDGTLLTTLFPQALSFARRYIAIDLCLLPAKRFLAINCLTTDLPVLDLLHFTVLIETWFTQ